MTKAEAIAMLKRIQEPEAWEPQINQAAFEALDMAIKALKAVTLCGECKYKMPNYHGGYRCDRGNRHRGWKEDWYCADGERRTDE